MSWSASRKEQLFKLAALKSTRKQSWNQIWNHISVPSLVPKLKLGNSVWKL